MAKVKYYVVWVGHKPGVYSTWEEAKKQINGFQGAKYKAYPSREEAELAFKNGFKNELSKGQRSSKPAKKDWGNEVHLQSVCVDAACSGNPGLLEYRGVETESGKEIFRVGPLEHGTNNLGEFLAIVHAAALLKRKEDPSTWIYTDSKTAISWVVNKKVKSTLTRSSKNEELWQLVDRAISWLQENKIPNKMVKWETKRWGEIPADFGRK